MKKAIIAVVGAIFITSCGQNSADVVAVSTLDSQGDLFVDEAQENKLHALLVYGGTRYGGTTGARFSGYYTQSVIDYGYVSAFDNARAVWNPISTKVQIDRSTTYTYANDLYFVQANDKRPTYGLQVGLKPNPDGSNTYVSAPNDSDWHHSEIVMYHGSFVKGYPDLNQRSSFINRAVIHELGHSLKLDHAPSTETSIMRDDLRVLPTSVQQYDRNDIIRKWGS